MASVLHEADIDLSAFGKIENESMKELILSLRDTSSGSVAEPIMWAKDGDNLAYGSTPADWRIRYLSDYRKRLNDVQDELQMFGWKRIYHIIAAMIQIQAQRDNLHIDKAFGTSYIRAFGDAVDYIHTVLGLRSSLRSRYACSAMPGSYTTNTPTTVRTLCNAASLLSKTYAGDTARYWDLVDNVFGSLHMEHRLRSDEWWVSGTILSCQASCSICSAWPLQLGFIGFGSERYHQRMTSRRLALMYDMLSFH